MSPMVPEITRRQVLTLAAAGTAGAALLSRTTPARAAATDTPAAPPGSIEERALALDPPVFLFQTFVPDQVVPGPGSQLRISESVGRIGPHSLQWDYAPGATVTINADLGYTGSGYRPGADQAASGSVDTFAVWIYNEHPVDDVLRFEFGRERRTDTWFDMHLDFAGWRTCWVRYGYDTIGRPRSDMDTVRIIAPKTSTSGTLYLSQLILNTSLAANHPTRDRQVPFVDTEGDHADNAHWLALLRFADLWRANPPAIKAPTADELTSLATLTERYLDSAVASMKVTDASVADLVAQVEAMGVPEMGMLGGGRPIMDHQSEVYPAAISADLTTWVDAVKLRAFTDLMQKVARAYRSAKTAEQQQTLSALYLRMIAHLRDQGWADGSCVGTVHHLGYTFRGYYDSLLAMRDVLAGADLLDTVRDDLQWYCGIGRTVDGFTDPRSFGGIMDIYNTTIRGMLVLGLLMPSDAERVAYVHVLQRWLDDSLVPSPGIEDGIKPDGSGYHHVGFYPDYVRDGFTGLTAVVAQLARTEFRVSSAAHERVKQTLLQMRIYADQLNWPLSISGRHPTGKTGVTVKSFQQLTTAGSPDGASELDPDVGAAFLRLLSAKPSTVQKNIAKQLAAMGVVAEAAPSGSWALGYAAGCFHRRDEWLAAVRGHNRYFWTTEIYPGENMYGRYVTYGQLQILSGGNPVDNLHSGYSEAGWDWNRWPGTTTIHLPFADLRADLTGQIEEMLLSDSRFGGAGTIDGKHGVFGMQLHESPKYDATHSARKSVFMFDDRIVALGSSITNRDRHHRTETTLFQVNLEQPSDPVIDSDAGLLTALPYVRPADELSAPHWLIDPVGNGYFVPAGQRLALTRTAQTSPDQSDTVTATGNFATAWLDHGSAPHDGRYEYAVIVNTSAAAMQTFAASMADPQAAPYTVLRHDESAHVVRDRASGITGYVVFEPRCRLSGPIRTVDTACLLMCYEDGDDLVLSVTDPDLRLYHGRDEDQYRHGQFVGGVSPFAVRWRDNPSEAHSLSLRISGEYRRVNDHDCQVRSHGGWTFVRVRCQDAATFQTRLTRR